MPNSIVRKYDILSTEQTRKFIYQGECPRCVVTNVLISDIVINEFEFQLRYYVHFRTDTLRKGMKLFIPQ